jgi:hypothetical protein
MTRTLDHFGKSAEAKKRLCRLQAAWQVKSIDKLSYRADQRPDDGLVDP